MTNPQDPGRQGWNPNPQPWNQAGGPQPPAGAMGQPWGQQSPQQHSQQGPNPPQGHYPQGQQHPQGQYPQGQYPQQAVPAQQPDAPGTTKRKSKTPAIIAAVVALTLIVGGGIFALNFFRTTANPAEALPANASMVVKLDLNPSDAKKLDAYRFLTRFPAIKKQLDSEDAFRKDPGKALWDALGLDASTGWNYDADVAPWIGDSVAIAGIATGGSEPTMLVSAHINDKAKARQILDSKGLAWAEHGDFALILPDGGDISAVAKQVNDEPLSKSTTYSADMGEVGSDGLLTFWFDYAGMVAFMDANGPQGNQLAEALKDTRLAGALHISPDKAEVRTFTHSGQAVAASDENVGDLVANLPDDSSVVLAGAVSEQTVNDGWAQLKQQLPNDVMRQIEEGLTQLGFALPDDLNTLLGKRFALVADVAGSMQATAGPESMRVGLVSDPRDAAKQAAVWQKLTDVVAQQAGFNLTYVSTGLSAGSTGADYANHLLAPQGRLSALDAYTKSVDVGSRTQFVAFVNPAAVKDAIQMMGEQSPELTENIEPILGVGATSEVVNDHGMKSVLRVTVK